MRHQEGRHSYLGGQAFRKEDTPRDLLSLKDSPIRRKDIPKDLLILKDSPIRRKKDIPRDLIILKDGNPRKEDIPKLEDKTPRKEDIPKDLLTLKDETPRRRTCLSWRTRPPGRKTFPGDCPYPDKISRLEQGATYTSLQDPRSTGQEDIPGVALILIRYENPRAQHSYRSMYRSSLRSQQVQEGKKSLNNISIKILESS